MRYHRHPVGYALGVALLVLVVLAWFVKLAAFLAVVLFISLVIEIVEYRRRVKRSLK